MTADVIVLGLGGVGSAAAFHLAARGKRVLGLEQYGAVHDRGSSHGGSRIIRQAYHEHPAYVPLVRRAYELWEDLERTSGSRLLQLTGGLMIGPPGSPVVSGTLQSAKEHDLPFELLDAREIRRRYPAMEPRADEVAVYELRAGWLRPETAVRAHLDGAALRGAEMHFEEEVFGWIADTAGGSVKVQTSRGEYEAEKLVLAPGAWASEMLRDLRIDFDIRRHVMCWFDPPGGVDPFLPESFPIYIWDVDGRDVFYGFPAVDGAAGGVKVAMHSGGAHTTAVTVDRHIHEEDVNELREHLERFLPHLNGPLLRAVTCLYTLTPDEHFVVTVHPEFPQVTVAAGFSGHGFKFTSVLGEILADLIVEGRTKHDIRLFDPGRFAPGHDASVTKTTG